MGIVQSYHPERTVWTLLAVAALAGNPYEGFNADVSATRTLSAEPAAVFEHLEQLDNLMAAFPDECAKEWVANKGQVGMGSRFRVTYVAMAMQRRLTGLVSRVDPPRILELDHEGKKGFVTRFALKNADGGTEISMTTYINQPPWPLRGYYFKRVQPAWIECHEKVLERIDGAVSAP